MPLISIYNVPIADLRGKFVEVNNVSNNTFFLRGNRDRALTSILVSGYGLESADALLQVVRSAVDGFEDETAGRNSPAMTPQEKDRKIKELRRNEEESPARQFSRECKICFASSPKSRAVLTACGHTVCMACALQMEENGRLDCPYCRKRSGYVKLHEENEEEAENADEKDEENEKEKEEDKENEKVKSATPKPRESAPPTVSRPTVFSVNAPEFVPRTNQSSVPLMSLNLTQSSASTSHNYVLPIVPLPTSGPTVPPGPITNYSVYIGNLAQSTREHALRELFSIAGQVHCITLPVDPRTGRRRNYGYCRFVEESSVENAVELFHGHNGLVVRRHVWRN